MIAANRWRRVAGITLALLSYGCGSSTTGPGRGVPATIRFSVDTLRLIQGEPQTIQFKVYDAANRDISGQSPAFSMEPGGAASLTFTGGQVTGTSVGTATVVATLGSATARLPTLVFGHPGGADVQRQPLGSRPYGVAVGLTFALITQLDAGTVTRFRLDPFGPVDTISTGNVPTGISLDATGTRALVTNQFDPSFGIIDVAANRQTKKLAATSTTFRTIFSPDGRRGYGTVTQGSLMVIDPVAGDTVATVRIVADANGIAFGPGDTLLFVTGMNGGISVVNTKTNTATATIPASGTLQDIAFTNDRSSFFVANESSSSIAVYSSGNYTQSASIDVGGPSFGLTLSPDGKQLWVAQTSLGRITIVDVGSRTVSRTIGVGGEPRRIAFDRFGLFAIVSDEAGNVLMIH
jgi:YVTN family beta-propeller protein